MYYSEIKTIDISNGIGCRTSIFVSGCDLHCKDCFNEIAWDFKSGRKFTTSTIVHILDTIALDHVAGLSILGGEPLHPKNREDVYKLVNSFRKRFTDTKTIWLWTGYTYEELLEEINYSVDDNSRILYKILSNIDILVDGPFESDKKDLLLKFKGSSNQRIIDMKKTLSQPVASDPVIWHDDEIFEDHGWPGRND